MINLSIITINLNNKTGLERTMQSVFNQSYTDFEYIIIDGCSTDGSIDVLNGYEEKITYWVAEKDNGIYNAMNKGIVKAKGEYCLFLNSGDYLYDNYVLENIFIGNPTEDILYGNVLIDFEKYQTLKILPQKITLFFLFKDTICHQVAFISKKLFDKIALYQESFQIASDYDFFLKAFIQHNCSSKYYDLTISVYNTNGISSKYEFAELIKKERNLIQTTNLDSKVIDLYNELTNEMNRELNNKDIQLLNYENTINRQVDLINKIYKSYSYKVGNILIKPFSLLLKLFNKRKKNA